MNNESAMYSCSEVIVGFFDDFNLDNAQNVLKQLPYFVKILNTYELILAVHVKVVENRVIDFAENAKKLKCIKYVNLNYFVKPTL